MRSRRIRPASSSPPGGAPGAAAGPSRPIPEPGTSAVEGQPDRPRPDRARLPGHREAVKEDHRGIGDRQRGAHLVLLARDTSGWRSLCRLISRANMAGTKAVPRFHAAALAEHAEGVVALSGCREGEIARRLRVGDRDGARAAAAALAEAFPPGSTSSCRITSCPTTTGSSRNRSRSPVTCSCRSSSRTTSITRPRKAASSRTS
jgi:hypothetical protein